MAMEKTNSCSQFISVSWLFFFLTVHCLDLKRSRKGLALRYVDILQILTCKHTTVLSLRSLIIALSCLFRCHPVIVTWTAPSHLHLTLKTSPGLPSSTSKTSPDSAHHCPNPALKSWYTHVSLPALTTAVPSSPDSPPNSSTDYKLFRTRPPGSSPAPNRLTTSPLLSYNFTGSRYNTASTTKPSSSPTKPSTI